MRCSSYIRIFLFAAIFIFVTVVVLVLVYIILEKNELNQCMGSVEYDYECITKIAQEKNNPDLCEKLRTQGTQGYCVAFVTQNVNDCVKLSPKVLDAHRVYCTRVVSALTKNVENCALIGEYAYMCVRDVALAANNSEICEIMRDSLENHPKNQGEDAEERIRGSIDECRADVMRWGEWNTFCWIGEPSAGSLKNLSGCV